MSRVYPVEVNRSDFDARAVVVLPDDFYDYVNEGPAVYVIAPADVPDIVEAVIDACWYNPDTGEARTRIVDRVRDILGGAS